MPCNSSDGMADAYREDPQARREIADLRRKNDELTRMLCELVTALAGDRKLPPELSAWWTAHQKWDESQGRP